MQSHPMRLAAAAGVCALVFGLAACSDDSDPEEASEAVPAVEPTSTQEARTEPELPVTSTLVNVGTGGCLRAFEDTIPPNAVVEDCQDDSGMSTFTISIADDGIGEIRPVDLVDENGELIGCIQWDARGAVSLETEWCIADFGWNLTYLKTDEAENADIWQFQAVGDEGKCLTVNDSPTYGTLPIIDTCEDGDENQQWRTVSA